MVNENDNAYPSVSRHSIFLIDDMIDDPGQLYDKYEVAKLIKSLTRDGIDKNPVFIRALRQIKREFRDELVPFLGIEKDSAKVELHNSWANINYPGAWNAPHLHNGCFYSGVFFIQAEGDEGDLRMVDTDHKIVSNFPSSQARIWAVSYTHLTLPTKA